MPGPRITFTGPRAPAARWQDVPAGFVLVACWSCMEDTVTPERRDGRRIEWCPCCSSARIVVSRPRREEA